jgi:hypothetical protein
MRRVIGLFAGTLLAALVSAPAAEGAFPGQRGKIAYVREEL